VLVYLLNKQHWSEENRIRKREN